MHIYSNVYIDSVVHPFDRLPSSIFVFQILNARLCTSENYAGPSVLVNLKVYDKDGEIFLYDTRCLLQNVGESTQQSHAPASQIAVDSLQGFCAVPIASL
jgi:hypothetical protein